MKKLKIQVVLVTGITKQDYRTFVVLSGALRILVLVLRNWSGSFVFKILFILYCNLSGKQMVRKIGIGKLREKTNEQKNCGCNHL